MTSRPILNHIGEEVGILELPDDTPESVWEKQLAEYAAPPYVPTPETELSKEELLAKIKELTDQFFNQ